jgi:PTS system nitrogen regulatory IIA component
MLILHLKSRLLAKVEQVAKHSGKENILDKHPKIRDCMKRKVFSVHVGTSVGKAASLVVGKRVGTLPVVDDEGNLVGVTTIKEIMQYFLPDFVSLLENIDFVKDFGVLESPSLESLDEVGGLSMSDIMEEPVAVDGDSSLIKSLAILEKKGLFDLPVVDDGRLIGIASRVDIVRAFLLEWQIPEVEKSEEEK